MGTLAWSLAVLKSTPSRWKALVELLPGELLRRTPAEGEWPALACLEHLVDTEREVFSVRAKRLLDGLDLQVYNPDAALRAPGASPDPATLAREFGRLRALSLEILSEITEADLSKAGNHPELGRVTLGELIHEWAGHDLMHTVQAERAMMQPFIEGCGPWKPYFADHVARK